MPPRAPTSFAFLLLALTSCARTQDIHETPEARERPCVSCHYSAYSAAEDPPHDDFPDTCSSCHTTVSWRPAALPDHSFFPLEGAHASTECKGCHGDPARYAGTPRECSGCHLPSYENAANPVHVGVLPQTCGNCHGNDAWTPARVDEHPWFKLEGNHLTAPCAGCHTGTPKRFAGTPQTCESCHLPSYEKAANPVHVGVLPQTCGNCHQATGWTPATVDSHPWFTLDGKHLAAPCEGCHTGTPKRFAGTPQTCDSCHQADFQRAATVVTGHQNFPQTCQDCHTTAGF